MNKPSRGRFNEGRQQLTQRLNQWHRRVGVHFSARHFYHPSDGHLGDRSVSLDLIQLMFIEPLPTTTITTLQKLTTTTTLPLPPLFKQRGADPLLEDMDWSNMIRARGRRRKSGMFIDSHGD
ncbi:hypothetical protein Tco_1316885 [Tanacetum coccineum]